MSAADDEALAAAVAAAETPGSAALFDLGEPDAPAVEDPQPPKRPRGRPRKNHTTDEAGSTGAPKAGRPRAARAPSRGKVNITQAVEQLYTLAGMGVSMAPMLDPVIRQAVGLSMAEQALPCAKAWDQLAKENEHVRRALEALLTVSSVGVLVAAHVPIVLAGVQASAARVVVVEQPAA